MSNLKNSKSDNFFILFANCIPVKGAIRSIICDLQVGKYYYIPNSLFEILQTVKFKKLKDIYSSFEEIEWSVLDEYFDYLVQNDLGFYNLKTTGFIDLSREWDLPCVVSNSILDIAENQSFDLKYAEVLEELQSLGCICLEIRSFNSIDIDRLKKILDLTLDSVFREIRLVMPYEKYFADQFQNTVLLRHKRIQQVIFFNAEDNCSSLIKDVQLYFIKNHIDPSNCGNVCRSQFSPTIEHLTEALTFNSCLNRKISIDSNGNIKNCPSQKEAFGNVMTDTLTNVLKNEQFKALWKIKKDDIKICKDCEYRYICTDCRIFTLDPRDQFSKPSKCTYDPYSASWN